MVENASLITKKWKFNSSYADVSNMLRHKNTPYSCGCCSPYWDKRESSRAHEKREWEADVDMELLWLTDSVMYDEDFRMYILSRHSRECWFPEEYEYTNDLTSLARPVLASLREPDE